MSDIVRYHICVYRNCYKSNNNRYGSNVSFFRFPVKDPYRLAQWKENCGNALVAKMETERLANTLLCEEHFIPDHILVNNKRKMLRRHAVPIKYVPEDNELAEEVKKEECQKLRTYPSKRVITSLDVREMKQENEIFVEEFHVSDEDDETETTASPSFTKNSTIAATVAKIKNEIPEDEPSLVVRSPRRKRAKIRIFKDEQLTQLSNHNKNEVKVEQEEEREKELEDPLALKDGFDVVHGEIAKMRFLTNKSENFLLHNDPVKNIVIFSCATNVNFLCNADTIYLDTTFGCCPKPFGELLCIHAYTNGVYMPLVFCLLPDKSADSYEAALVALHDSCSRLKCHLTPCEVVIDFNKNAYNALTKIWPTVSVVGCHFHLSQIWYRKLCELGLSGDYKDPGSATGKWLRSTFGLIHQNPVKVKERLQTDLVAIQPKNEKTARFYHYLYRNYVDEFSNFPPYIWASASFDSEHVTNVCESFDSYFTVCFSTLDPNVFVFVDELKKFQAEIYNQISISKKQKKQEAKNKKDVNVMVEKNDYGFHLPGF